MRVLFCIFLAINLYAESIYASFDVVARKSAKLSLSALGVVKSVNVDVGKTIKKDDLLLELDSDVESVGLSNARAELNLANTALNHARATYNRYLQVKSVVNQQILDDVNFKKNEAELRVRMAQSGIAKYETLIKQKKLKAPFDGIISAKYIEVGEGVAGPSQPLFLLETYPEVKLLLSFDEKYEDLVKIGDTYEYTINGLKMSGKISKIYPSIDVKTRKIYAEVLANDLTIGSFGEGYIITGK